MTEATSCLVENEVGVHIGITRWVHPFVNGLHLVPVLRPSWPALETMRPGACVSTAGPRQQLKKKREAGMLAVFRLSDSKRRK
jgi:hypothetical protein